jgi:outer membrane protease
VGVFSVCKIKTNFNYCLKFYLEIEQDFLQVKKVNLKAGFQEN